MLFHVTLALVMLATTANRGGRLLLALYALKLGAQPLAVGLLAATFAVFPTTLSWPIGMLVDRFGARWMLALGSTSLILGAIVPYFFPVLPAIFLAAVFFG